MVRSRRSAEPVFVGNDEEAGDFLNSIGGDGVLRDRPGRIGATCQCHDLALDGYFATEASRPQEPNACIDKTVRHKQVLRVLGPVPHETPGIP